MILYSFLLLILRCCCLVDMGNTVSDYGQQRRDDDARFEYHYTDDEEEEDDIDISLKQRPLSPSHPVSIKYRDDIIEIAAFPSDIRHTLSYYFDSSEFRERNEPDDGKLSEKLHRSSPSLIAINDLPLDIADMLRRYINNNNDVIHKTRMAYQYLRTSVPTRGFACPTLTSTESGFSLRRRMRLRRSARCSSSRTSFKRTDSS